MSITRVFNDFATAISRLAGRAWTFVISILLVVAWAVTGPLFDYSDTWQLIINTATTVATFLMVFVIQNTQNRDNAALQAKLDELIRISAAENRFIGIERLPDKELEGILREVEEHAEAIAETGERKPAKPAARKTQPRKPATRKPKKR